MSHSALPAGRVAAIVTAEDKGKGAMRKTVGFVLLGLAGFLLTAALLAQFYVPGQVQKTPLDVNTTTRLSGNAARPPERGGLRGQGGQPQRRRR